MSRLAFPSRAAALGLLAAVLAVLYWGIAVPAADYFAESRESLAQLKAASQRYSKAADELPRLRAELAALEQERQGSVEFLEEANETLAAAAVQSRVKGAVQMSGGELHSMENVTSPEKGAPRRVAVRARLSTGLGGLSRIMTMLNETAPILFIGSLDVRAREAQGNGPMPQNLEVDLVIYGYLGAQG